MVMAKKQPFTLVYADEVKDHLRAIGVKDRSRLYFGGEEFEE